MLVGSRNQCSSCPHEMKLSSMHLGSSVAAVQVVLAVEKGKG